MTTILQTIRAFALTLAITTGFAASAVDLSCVEIYHNAAAGFRRNPLGPPRIPSAELRKTEDAYRLMQIYQDVYYGRLKSGGISDLMQTLHVPPEREYTVLNEVVRLLESGELCADNKPAKTWSEIMALLRGH
jgi:hypothetical protein